MGIDESPLPKDFARAYFAAEDRTVFLNKKLQVAQWEHPGADGAKARTRTSTFPLERAKRGVPIIFPVSPQPADMPPDWEQCVASIPHRRGDWEDPHILYRNVTDHAVQEADPRPNAIEDELPAGWTKELDVDGDPYFFDHDTGMATYDDPRYVENPEPSLSLQAQMATRQKKRSSFQKNVVTKKTWIIGPEDLTAFSAIDNQLTSVDEIPKHVRNKVHNRYMDILPNPRTSVKLPMIDGDPTSTYVNANYVRGPEGQAKFYIGAMGPLPGTVVNFWRMLWETRTAAIIMVTGILEKGRKKCERYWPADVDNKTEMKFGDITVVAQQEAVARGYVYTLLRVQRGSEVRKIGHFFYNSWPDHGVPRDASGDLYPDSVLGMLHTVHKWCSKVKDRPIVVHCSAGVGRTGTIIAIDHCRYRLKHQGRVDPLQIVDFIRQDRCALVQHPIQFKFVHAACMKYADLHKHAYTVEKSEHVDELETRARRMSLADRQAKLQEEKAAAKSRQQLARRGRMRRSIMTKSQMHGELRTNVRHTPRTSTSGSGGGSGGGSDGGANNDEDIETLWRIFDLDGDGSISMREARMQGIDVETFKAMDTDGNGSISLEEFKAYYKQKMAE